MTTGEMIAEVRAGLGNRTDILDTRYTQWLNWALLDLCGFHRKRVFPSKRFKELERVITIEVGPVSAFVDTGSTTTRVYFVSGTLTIDEPAYLDSVLEIEGERRTIVRITRGTQPNVIVDEPFSEVPVPGTEVYIYSRRVEIQSAAALAAKDQVWALEILEYIDGQPLSHDAWHKLIHKDSTFLGRPGSFARHGNYILFDSTPGDRTFLRGYVYMYPELLDSTLLNVRTNLSVVWDEVIILGAVYRGFERLMEPDRAKQTQERYIYEATNKMDSHQAEDRFIEYGLKVR